MESDDDKGAPDDMRRQPFRGLVYALPIFLAMWAIIGLMLWAIFSL